MNKITFTDNNKNMWYRVNKTTAKKLYNAGRAICFCPSNLRPFGVWNIGYITTKEELTEKDIDADFDKFINQFEYYNCINAETGRRTAYYVKQENVF